MTVFGKVVGLSSRRHDDHDGIHVRHVVRGQNDWAVPGHMVEAAHAQPEEEPHDWIKQDTNPAVVRVPQFDRFCGPDATSSDNGRPSLLPRFAHAPPSMPEVSTFTGANNYPG